MVARRQGMMPVRDKSYKMFIAILAKELQVAYGCTEPASVAYASALASSHLPIRPEWISISCNSNIVKNVKSVVIPFTNGRRGIQAAAAAGIFFRFMGKFPAKFLAISPDLKYNNR